MKLKCNKVKPPLAGVITAEYLKSSHKINIEWCNETIVENAENKVSCATSNEVCRALARLLSEKELFGTNPQEKTEVDHWMTFSVGPLCSKNDFSKAITYLNQSLGPITYLVGKRLTIADFSVFAALYASKEWQLLVGKQDVPPHVQRWYSLISSNEAVIRALDSFPEEAKTALTATVSTRSSLADKSIVGQRNQEGKFVDMPGAEMGKVIVRFPPEASGYLHIGHAKAALLNQYYQQAFNGKLIMRFDDTNPAKENVHFEKVILEDIEMLNIKPDLFTHTSNYFDLMIEYCEKMLKEGKAYVDDTEPELMKQQREQKIENDNRRNTVEKNFAMWEEMKKGSEKGLKCCVRAKIDMQSPNGCMRDSTIYRCKNEVHPRTGTKYKVYPTYDFACPIVDAIEDVTHTLRTMEYHDRDAQFYWFIEALGLRRPYIWEYSRLSMTNTVLSKRKLTWFVQNHHVDGWDDPRFPTVRGVLRRGMTVEGLKQFIIAQGSSRSVVFMEWDKIWSFNKKVIDPIAPKYTAVNCESYVPVLVEGIDKPEVLTVPLHPKNAEVGTKQIWVGPKILIDYEDAECLKEGENTTFINWGNLMIKKINRDKNNVITSVEAETNLENKDYKKTLKLTWLCDTEQSQNIACYVVFFDHIISKPLLAKDEDFKQYIGHQTRFEFKMLGDPEMKKLKVGDIIQLQRRGYFRVDVAYEGHSDAVNKELPIILFHIPDGHAKENPLPKYQFEEPSRTAYNIYNDIITWNEKLTKLQLSKAPKEQMEEAEKKVYFYKEEFNVKTGVTWVPHLPSPPRELKRSIDPNPTQKLSNTDFVKAQIEAQEKLLMYLKTYKSNSSVLEEEQKNLDELKKALQKAPVESTKTTGKASSPASTLDVNGVLEKIAAQSDKIRGLKAKKAEKTVIEPEIKVLLSLKEDYKKLTGQDWKPGATAPKSADKKGSSSSDQDILDKISAQGEKVRKLKAEKAGKTVVEPEVKFLLALKADYKNLTGKEWKPGTVASQSAQAAQPSATGTGSSSEADILDKIAAQGEKVRKLKSEKAEKTAVDVEVKVLLALKEEYKKLTGKEWKPGTTASKPVEKPSAGTSEQEILEKIAAQGDKIRKLKSEKAEKSVVEPEVKVLLALKEEYKKIIGKDWKPGAVASTPSLSLNTSVAANTSLSEAEILDKIAAQGEKVRKLKSERADKATVEVEVKALLALKADYKNLTGNSEWKPGTVAKPSTPIVSSPPVVATIEAMGDSKPDTTQLTNKINEQGAVVRNLKSAKAPNEEVDAAVKILLDLKADYKKLTGTEFPVAERTPSKPQEAKEQVKETKVKQQAAKKNEKKPVDVDDSNVKKQTRLGLEARKEENLSDWYSQVITKGEMIEYYDVSGCYIFRPWSFSIWEAIKDWFDCEIKKLGVQNCYFPIFVSKSVLGKEQTHIADFAPEVAWVTKSGDSEMAEPIAVRPTSETVMYPAYAKWVQSYRDLPIKLNQWNNVVRWEFKHPQPFLRTREFLWQEGHTAYANKEEADVEVKTILDLYARIYTDLLAIPVVKGRKTEKEKFAGGDYTFTVEGFVSASGRAIQGATSHHLGQNFSKMFDITFEDPDTQEKKHVFQNSWGITTRTIGVMIMIHADNQGLILPPNVASVQIVIVPCGLTVSLSDADKNALIDACDRLEKDLLASGVKVKGDYRSNYSPGWKFNHWELKGVPIRIEYGPKDLKNKQIVAVRRDTGEKVTTKIENAIKELGDLLEKIQKNLFDKASNDLNTHMVTLKDWSQFGPNLDKKNIILAPFCGEISCEDKIKADSARDDSEAEPGAPAMGAKSLCIPLEQPEKIKPDDKCIHPDCQRKAKYYTLFGRSY